jgi:hypothetical protein
MIMAGTVGWVLIALAAVGFFFILRGLMREYKLLGFPVADGSMVSCDPLLGHTSTMPAKAGRRSSSPMWTIAATYTYSVNGIRFEGHRLSNLAPQVIVRIAHAEDDPPEKIANLCRQYAAGTAVRVHYDPKNPKWSFVYFTSPLRDWPWALFPLALGLAGWLLIHLSRFAGR